MTFDAELKRAFDALAERLRAEMARQIQSAIDELAGSAEAARDRAVADARAEVEASSNERVNVAVAAAESRARNQALEDGRAEGRREAEGERDRAIAEARATAEQSSAERVSIAVAAAKSRAREQALEDGRAEGRRQAQQEYEQERAAADAAAAAVHAESRSRDAAANERLLDAVRSIDRARSLTEILDTLVSCAAREASRAAVLMIRGGRVRGWRAIGFGPIDEGGDSIDLTFGQAGIVADAAQSGCVSSDGRAPEFATGASGDQLAVPIAISGEVVAVLYAEQGPRHALEIIARHAARRLESVAAFKAARALLAQGPGVDAAGRAAEAADEDVAARRYARLLVSEIKLYHEAEVVSGRRERDLGSRLGGEIARARVLYDERVPLHVRRRADHFHDELVRTLADGDSTLLELKT
jgi:hypothetical protein